MKTLAAIAHRETVNAKGNTVPMRQVFYKGVDKAKAGQCCDLCGKKISYAVAVELAIPALEDLDLHTERLEIGQDCAAKANGFDCMWILPELKRDLKKLKMELKND